MTGYQMIMNLPSKERAELLGICEKDAERMKTLTLEELRRHEAICIEEMKGIDLKGKCRDHLLCCYDCRKEFLDEEIQNWSEDNNS